MFLIHISQTPEHLFGLLDIVEELFRRCKCDVTLLRVTQKVTLDSVVTSYFCWSTMSLMVGNRTAMIVPVIVKWNKDSSSYQSTE